MSTRSRFSPFVQLKTGSEKQPILLVHGLSGIASFSELAKHIRTKHAIYGIQAKGVDGMEEPFERIEDMAAFYLDALNDLQPDGPYILIGYSFGGLVALEMARRLSESGRSIALLVLVDAYPHPRYLSTGQRLRLVVQRIRRHISEMKRRSVPGAISYLVRRLKARLRTFVVRGRGTRFREISRPLGAQTTLRVKERAYVAFGRYRPRFYRGKIMFVKSASDSYFPADPVAVWSDLSTEFESKTVPGGHMDMVRRDFQDLAAVLTYYVNRALCEE
jgi:acetoacetyl-CoA synthetase